MCREVSGSMEPHDNGTGMLLLRYSRGVFRRIGEGVARRDYRNRKYR